MIRKLAAASIMILLSAAATAAQDAPIQQLPSVELPPELEYGEAIIFSGSECPSSESSPEDIIPGSPGLSQAFSLTPPL